MITVILLGYIACVVIAFKFIKIKVTPTSVAVAVVTGVFMMGGIVIVWKQSAPMTEQMVLTRHVLQIIPDEREFVSKVHVKGNQTVKKGDPLFEIEPDRFQRAVDESTAQLTAAKSKVSELESAVQAAQAAVKKSEADNATAKAELDTALAIKNAQPAAIAKLQVAEAQQKYILTQAGVALVKAQLKESEFTLDSAKHAVDVAQAALNTASFNLERCNYTSQVDGIVMNFQVREGTPVARWRFASVGTIMDLKETAIIAIYPQNLLSNVKAGDKVEVAFTRLRGKIADGKVEAVVPYTGEGQLLPSGNLPIAANLGSKGKLAVLIRLDDNDLAKELPMGAAGAVAIYTDFAQPFHLVSQVTIRIKGWMYFLLPA